VVEAAGSTGEVKTGIDDVVARRDAASQWKMDDPRG
jgi:hypothetical protein